MAIYPSGPDVYPWSLVFPGAVLALSVTTAIPEFQVHIGWESTASGAFILDGSVLDSGDLLDGFGVDAFAGEYDDVSADVASEVRIRRGRNDYLSSMQAGEIEFELFNPSNQDLYNPNASASASPIRAKSPGFAPMRPVRIQAVYGGVTFPIFVGYLRHLEWNSETKRAKVNAVDLFLWLSRSRPTFTNGESAAAGVTNTATAIEYVLEKSNWTRTSLIDIDSRGGDAVSSFSAAASANKTSLSIIEELLTAERGYFVIGPDGKAKYRSRVDRAAKISSAVFEGEQARFGSALDLEWNSETKRAKVNAVDLFLWLSRSRPTFTNGESAAAGVTNTATAIEYVLEQSNWTRTSLIDMDSRGGDAVSSFSSAASANKTSLSIIEELLTAERGYFVIGPDGKAKYRSRVDRAAKISSAVCEGEPAWLGSALDLDRITNKITVTASGSSFPQTASDPSSIALYGLAEGSSISSSYITTNDQALALARYLVGLYAVPRPPVSITLSNDSPLTLIRQMTLEIGDRVTIPSDSAAFVFGSSKFGSATETFGGATDDYHVEQIEHRISTGGNYIETSYLLSQRGAESFVFGRSTFGSTFELFSL